MESQGTAHMQDFTVARPASMLGRRVTDRAGPRGGEGSTLLSTSAPSPDVGSLDSVQAGRSGEAWELSLSLHGPDTWNFDASRHGLSKPLCNQWMCLSAV